MVQFIPPICGDNWGIHQSPAGCSPASCAEGEAKRGIARKSPQNNVAMDEQCRKAVGKGRKQQNIGVLLSY